MTALESKVRRTEVKMATTMVKHNVPLAFADHLSPLLKDLFADSEIAKAYSSAKTKATCILNGALWPFYLEELTAEMKLGPFSLSIDGSNDTGREKMNPMTVHVFSNSGVERKFLDMCTTSGQGAGTAEVIFNKIDSVLLKHEILGPIASACQYALSHLPFDDDVLLNAQFVNIQRRVTADFTQVAYFVERFPILLPFCDTKSQEQLFEQFTSCQTMHDSAIPLHIWSDANVTKKGSSDGEDYVYYRMDTLWAYLSTVKDGATGLPTFSLLSKVEKLVLTLPHSNADEERVFSLIRQNKTDFWNSLALGGTLSSILTVKMSCQEPCYKFEPTADVIKKSKKATWEYNQAHSSKDK